MNPPVEVFDARLQALFILLPCHSIHSRRGLPL